MDTSETLVTAMQRAARSDKGVRFIDTSQEGVWLSYADLFDRSNRAATALAAAGVCPGDRVALILRTSPTFYDAFFGALGLGAVPVPMYPPFQLGVLEAWRERTADLLRRAKCSVVVVHNLYLSLVEAMDLDARVVSLDVLPSQAVAPRQADADDVALIQFSSGTTDAPKGVRLTHRQILANVDAIRSLIISALPEHHHTHVGASWLPLYHDMGLIGCVFTSLVHAAELILIPPEVFMAHPHTWLSAISTYRVTVSPAPNFAFGYCASRISDEDLAQLDLSCWKLILNGAEAVTQSVCERFFDRMRSTGLDATALTPVYGLAEAGLIVTASPVARSPRFECFSRRALTDAGLAEPAPDTDGLILASVGPPVGGLQVSIRGPEGSPLPERSLGAIHICGPSLMLGYEGEPEISKDWLDTGDLGFLYDGELFIYGRKKDVLVIRGRNYAPEPFEQAALGIPGARYRSAAFSIPDPETGTECAVIVVERSKMRTHSDDDIAKAVTRSVRERTGLGPRDVAVWDPGTLPRTSNGKIRRGKTRALYLSTIESRGIA
ncbi:MAG: AMP-binding protein [Myxococcota bacterium]|nr:AMP-binding protein [Myxococcota bacterium]